ncbi:MAG TPA: hypothetical protein VF549_05585 [Solirubrobacteraceae bacterium]
MRPRKIHLLALGALTALVAAAPAGAHVGSSEPRGAARDVYYDGSANAFTAQARAAEPPADQIPPRADCLPGGIPEGEMQGRVEAGKAEEGYRCNLSVIGHTGSTGGFRVHRYVDKDGHECAYYDTALLFPTNAFSLSAEPTGVAVLDMTDPTKPARTTTLVTPAMQTPHESFNISVERGLLAAVTGNPSAYPGIVDVYDISKDCRAPELQASLPAAIFGHESGFALDGKTFYPTSIGTGHTTAVDLTNPRVPTRIWEGSYGTHGMSLSDDGNTGYFAAGDGLYIVDLSEIQARKPDPQVREISHLTWSTMTIPQYAVPVTIDGKPYLVEVDEYSESEGDDSGVAGNGKKVGAARIIDISDPAKPFVVSNIRLQVHQPENRDAIGGDPGAQSPVQGYAAHYCNVPQRREPGIVACSMILSGLRVFDIRDPEHPKEIAYHVAPPSTISATGSPVIDEKANWAMSEPAFVPERGEIWYSDGTSGFYALRMDPRVWPFQEAKGSAGPGCVDTTGFLSVGAAPAGRRVQLQFARRADLPVRVDVFRVSRGRRILREHLVARFDGRTRPFTWNGRGRRVGKGAYFVRFRMVKDGRPYDTRRVVLTRDARGRWRARPPHYRRASCNLLRAFKLERPVFGGRQRTPLAGAYRLAARARVTVTISRGSRIVKRFATSEQDANRTIRFSLPARGLPRGDYTVRLVAQSGDDQVSDVLTSRRL